MAESNLIPRSLESTIITSNFVSIYSWTNACLNCQFSTSTFLSSVCNGFRLFGNLTCPGLLLSPYLSDPPLFAEQRRPQIYTIPILPVSTLLDCPILPGDFRFGDLPPCGTKFCGWYFKCQHAVPFIYSSRCMHRCKERWNLFFSPVCLKLHPISDLECNAQVIAKFFFPSHLEVQGDWRPGDFCLFVQVFSPRQCSSCIKLQFLLCALL